MMGPGPGAGEHRTQATRMLGLAQPMRVYNRVCFVLAICVGLVLSTACVSTPHGSAELAELSERDRHSLSSVIVAALQQHFMPAKTVFALRPAGPVGQRVAQRLQQLGYGVTPQQQADTQWLRYRISYHQERVIYLSLAVDTGWRLDRLYIPDIHGELRPANMATLRDDDQPRRPPAPAVSRSAPGIASSIPSKIPSKNVPAPVYLPATPRPVTSRLATPRLEEQCGRVRLEPGSLRSNVTRILRRCGYTLGNWVLGDGGYIDDWVIQQPYAVTVSGGITNVLKLLDAQYALSGEIRQISQTVDFNYRGEPL